MCWLALAAIATLFFTWALWRSSNRRQEAAKTEADSRALKLEQAASDSKAAQQRVEIDLSNTQKEVAEARTKQAEAEKELLALNQRVMREKLPRWARLEPLGEYVKGRPAGSVEIVFVPDDDEAVKTALGIEMMLSADGKWKILKNSRPISPNEPDLVLPQYATPEMGKNPFHMPLITRMGLLGDITVIASPADLIDGFPKEATAVHALWKGLHACGFQTVTNIDSRLPAGTTRIVVGAKE